MRCRRLIWAADLIRTGDPVESYERFIRTYKQELDRLIEADKKAGGTAAGISGRIKEKVREKSMHAGKAN
jgi:hypothetical protein